MPALLHDGRPFLGRAVTRLGLSRQQLYDAVLARRVRRLFSGVYIDGAIEDTRELRLEAISLITPPHAIVSDCSASWVWGVDTFRPSDRSDLTPLLLVPNGAARVDRANVRCREADLDPGDIVDLGPVRLTSPVRTASDLLRRLWRPYALAAADGLVRAGLVSQREVTAYVGRLKGYRGIVQARQLAALIDAGAESPAESWTRLRLLDAGLPRPTTQIPVLERTGRVLYRVDVGYEALRIGVEFDGAEFHSDRADVEHDEVRRTHLAAKRGWRMVVVRRDDVLGDDSTFEEAVAAWPVWCPSRGCGDRSPARRTQACA